MAKVRGLLKILSNEEMDQIHQGAVKILAEVGMKIDCYEALDHLDSYGCQINYNSKVVKFPPDIVESAVRKMRDAYASKNYRDLKMPVRYTEVYFSTRPRKLVTDFTVNAGGFPVYILDLDEQRRKANLKDVIDSIRLADALDNINLIGLPCSAQEIPAKNRPIVMAAELVKNTSKLGGIEAWTRQDVEYLYKMGLVVSGGEEKFRKCPILVGYSEVRSPLCLDKNMTEVFMEYVKRGIPQSLDTMPMGGISAPATSAGTLTLGIAETLGGLVLGYCVNPDAILRVDITPGLGDMKSGIFPYAGADRLALLVGAIQMITNYYGCPGGTHGGKTDACFPGVQAGFEKALSIIYPILAGATGVGTLGQLENGTTFSPVQLVIDNEIVRYVKRMLNGFEVNQNKLALNVIKEVGIGGNYLTHPHTAGNFREEFWLSDLTERMSWTAWEKEELKGIEEKAKEKTRQIIEDHHPEPLDEDKRKMIDEIVEEALKKEGDRCDLERSYH